MQISAKRSTINFRIFLWHAIFLALASNFMDVDTIIPSMLVKAGGIGLTFALATELAPHVTVNAVAPGPVDTGLLTAEVKKKLSSQTPFGRIAKPQEIAHTVIYLLENDYVSGEVVDVNAGRYMD